MPRPKPNCACIACAGKKLSGQRGVILGLLVSQGRTMLTPREMLCEQHRAEYQESMARFLGDLRSEVASKARRALG